MKYEGEWLNDVQHGFGKETLLDGLSYEGEFLNGQRNGHGVFKMKDAIFDGEFKNNSINGWGKFMWKDGKKYVGECQNNQVTYYFI